MKNFRLLALFVLVLFIIKACDNSKNQLDTKFIKNELENRKIQKISESDILTQAFSKGQRVIDTLTLESKKIKVMEKDTTLEKQYRLGGLQPLVDLLQQENKAEIKKIISTDLETDRIREPEKEIYEAYNYNIAKGLKVDHNVQVLDQHIFYSAPIMEEGELKGMWSIYFDKRELVKTIN